MKATGESDNDDQGSNMNSDWEELLHRRHIPRLCGADVELANYLVGVDNRGRSSGEAASKLLLAQVPGVVAVPRAKYLTDDERTEHDFGAHGRKFLPSNGSSIYIDLDHLELCLPEVIGARDHLAAYHAMLRVARRALVDANRQLAESGATRRVEVLVNNSDGHDASYGSHLDMAMTRRGFMDLFRKPSLLAGLASYQASSIVFSGQGKVGSEDGAPPVDYQISQRADFCRHRLVAHQTTYDRPIVNCRDEPLCGRHGGEVDSRIARLHCIFYDSNLCHVAHLLKIGVLQIVITMIEAGALPPELALDDPADAAMRWSHDPSLRRTAHLASGRSVTCVDHQLMWLDAAERFLSHDSYESIIPDLDEIIQLWGKTLQILEAATIRGDFTPLIGDLDWVLKQFCLRATIDNHADLNWQSPAVKSLDHCYSNLDLNEGLYWSYEQAGIVNRLVTDEEIERFEHNPPDNTRAWTRAHLLRMAPSEMNFIDWDRISFQSPDDHQRCLNLPMDDPFSLTRHETETFVTRARSITELVDGLKDISNPC